MLVPQIERETVRGIVRRWGWNATAYQVLNPGFRYWIDTELDAAVGFVEHSGVRVVGGAPICAESQLERVLERFESNANGGVIYFGAEARLAAMSAHDSRRRIFPIGAQPVWTPSVLLQGFAKRASLRAQLNRARNKDVTTRLLASAYNEEPLRVCLREWIERRGLPPLHFLIETETLKDLVDRRVAVAERNGRIIGFIVATPIPARNGWLIEQIVRGQAAPNGTAELMLHDVAVMLEREGAEIVTLGLAPLAKRGSAQVQNAPRWLFGLLSALRAHGTRFYNFTGLESFKSKFGGETWETVYATTAPGTSLTRALIAVTEAFSAEPIGRFMFRSVWRSVRAHAALQFHGLSGRHPSRASSSAHA